MMAVTILGLIATAVAAWPEFSTGARLLALYLGVVWLLSAYLCARMDVHHG